MSTARAQRSAINESIAIPPLGLDGHLAVPAGAAGVVIFAHGSGSSRHSPRNKCVATMLNRAGVGTLLFDLLRPFEAEDRTAVFDIDLLAERLILATRWLRQHTAGTGQEMGYFGASTGAAAALAASVSDGNVKAVVSRGGRPDLADRFLPYVSAPTLLIVGGDDRDVLALNRRAMSLMTCKTELVVIPHASHLFEEAGALDQVADHALRWFQRHFTRNSQSGGGDHV
jgi:pimeloyl-ACP methyl ester carboxylesterase